MYRTHTEDITLFNPMFIKKMVMFTIMTRARRIVIICFASKSHGKLNVWNNGVIVWNSILFSDIPVDASHHFFQNVLTSKAKCKNIISLEYGYVSNNS